MKIQKLNWDSEFFNLEVAELHIDEYNDTINLDTDYDLIYVKSDTDNLVKINKYQASYTETKVVFIKQILDTNIVNKNVIEFNTSKDDIDALYNLAFESGKQSRFKLDKNFTTDQFQDLYKLWIDNSINKTFADEILVFKQDDSIKGLVTYKIKSDKAIIGLIATNPTNQGQGIGTQLLHEVERRVKQKGISFLEIPTQLQNEPACKFYYKQGYKIQEQLVIKHFWKL